MNLLPSENQGQITEYVPILVQEYKEFKILRMAKRGLKSADDFIKIIEEDGTFDKEDDSFNTLNLMRNYLVGEEVGKIIMWLDKMLFKSIIITANNLEEFNFLKTDSTRYKNVKQLILSRNKIKSIDIKVDILAQLPCLKELDLSQNYI